jgi:hypothetical protein
MINRDRDGRGRLGKKRERGDTVRTFDGERLKIDRYARWITNAIADIKTGFATPARMFRATTAAYMRLLSRCSTKSILIDVVSAVEHVPGVMSVERMNA